MPLITLIQPDYQNLNSNYCTNGVTERTSTKLLSFNLEPVYVTFDLSTKIIRFKNEYNTTVLSTYVKIHKSFSKKFKTSFVVQLNL